MAKTALNLKWDIPPKAKVYEALSAVADERVKLIGTEKAEVTSSSGSKSYVVEWSPDGRQIASNDNASYWQGYLGYPIIAALLVRGKIAFERDVLQHLAGIPWKKLNTQYKNDYEKAVASVLASLAERGVETGSITKTVDDVYEQVQKLDLEKLGKRRPPPTEKRQK